ncbi:hypothetical protein ACHAXM_001267 [Skeletonema potamos]
MRSRSRGPGITGQGRSVSVKDIKVLDLTAMEAHRSTPASRTSTKKTKTTVATEFSSSSEESQMRINRARDHIHKQQMLDEQSVDQWQQQQQLDRGRSRSQSRPRDRDSATNNSCRSRSRPRLSITSNNSSKDSSLSRAKALLEQMEQKETAKAAVSSRERTRSPPTSRGRGRSKSRPRTRPDEMGSRIEKLVNDVIRHRSRSRPPPPKQQQQRRGDANLHQEERSRSSRSRSRPPSSNYAKPARSRSRPREKKSENDEGRRRRSEKDTISQRRGSSLHQSITSHGDKRGNEHLEKELRKYVQVGQTPQSKQQDDHKQRRSSKLSSREEHHKHHQYDRTRAEHRVKSRGRSISSDGHKRDGSSRHRAKSPKPPQKERRVARSKSPYTRGLRQRNVARSKSSTRSMSPYQEKKNSDHDDDESSSSSCSSSNSSSYDNNAQKNKDDQPQKVDKNGCCIYHPFVQLQKKKKGGEWIILSRTCAMCKKRGSEENSLIYIPHGPTTDELNPQMSVSQPSTVKQGSVNALVPMKPAGGENSLTVSAVESDDEDSDDDASSASSHSASSSSSTEYSSDEDKNVEDSEDDNSSVESIGDKSNGGGRQQSHRLSSSSNQSESKTSYDKIISSADELLDELMYTEISVSEESKGKMESGNRRKKEKKRIKEKEKKKVSRRKRSSISTKSNERGIDMSKLESALHKIRSKGDLKSHEKDEHASQGPPMEVLTANSRTPPPANRSIDKPRSDAIDSEKAMTPKPSAPKQQQHSQQHSRPPPPPPPPYQHGQSMAVLHSDSEPELTDSDDDYMNPPAQHNYYPQTHAPAIHHMQAPTKRQAYQHQSYAPEMQHPPNQQHQQAPDDWTKYAVKCSARLNEDGSKKKERRKSKMSSKVPNKLSNHDNRTHLAVKNMPFTDHLGDFGFYTGQVNDNGRPDGKGSMKYDSGIFYEGMWTDGCQEEKAVTQYVRIRGGFTSWGGKGKATVKSGKTLPWNATKIDRHDENDKTNVRGMEWVDLNGDSGRYTGEVNKDQLPHGKGIMKYDFGLIAEGEWVNGMLKENPLDRMISAAALNSSGQSAGALSVISGARSVALGGGMSVGPGMSGGMSVGPMRPPIFVGGGMPQGSVYGGMPQMIQPQQVMPQQMMMNPMMMMMPHQPNNTAQQHTIIAQQNAMMKRMYSSASGSVYGGGSLYGGPIPMAAQMPPSQQQIMPMQQQQPPPITEIKLN